MSSQVICPKCGLPCYKELKRIKCGKPNCKCKTGKPEDLHGPYWYAYHITNGKVHRHYIGKTWPTEPSKRFPYVKGVKK